MEMKTVERWTYEDFDPEEIEEAHNSKANKLEMEQYVKARSFSESKEFTIDIEKILEASFEAAPECCIYRVPRDLRKINEEAYTPQVVSIGPLHHGRQEYLIEMEKQKLMYVKMFSERTSMDKLKELKSFIEDNERRIRNCYAENSNLLSDEFVTVILYDAVFIIELFLRNDEAKNKTGFDILLDTPIRKAAIKLDLQLLENQLPYFVLKDLFSILGDVAKPSGEDQYYRDPLLILASDHLEYNTNDLRHFTDLRRYFLVKEFIPPKNIGSIIFNCLGDNAAIANMFNKLGLHVTPSYSGYYEVAEKLKAHYGNRWNHSKATLKRVYFSDPWIGTGTVAAALLLLLTLAQAVCSILQVL
ncbi:hypothetical protein Ddye_018242 [Dipteronia dyeriana]|uniref:Uncharacterized protein n=1 Tax=Dipteronia dyeriana TaxID=168575 RepID=A0AAD9UAT8_9ROSI|nr:hypothetical protein Ddye_018242 [Dipteronia dyeriana]